MSNTIPSLKYSVKTLSRKGGINGIINVLTFFSSVNFDAASWYQNLPMLVLKSLVMSLRLTRIWCVCVGGVIHSVLASINLDNSLSMFSGFPFLVPLQVSTHRKGRWVPTKSISFQQCYQPRLLVIRTWVLSKSLKWFFFPTNTVFKESTWSNQVRRTFFI